MFDANQYDEWYERNPRTFESELRAIRPLLPSGTVVEIGCGTGRFTAALGITAGIEPDTNMRELARKRGVHVIDARAEQLPFLNNSLDGLLFLTALCFIDEPGRALAEARRVLKPGGIVIVTMLDAASPGGAPYAVKLKERHGGHIMDCAGTVELLRQSGFAHRRTLQTLFHFPAGGPVEEPLEGSGQGIFVAIQAQKPGNRAGYPG